MVIVRHTQSDWLLKPSEPAGCERGVDHVCVMHASLIRRLRPRSRPAEAGVRPVEQPRPVPVSPIRFRTTDRRLTCGFMNRHTARCPMPAETLGTDRQATPDMTPGSPGRPALPATTLTASHRTLRATPPTARFPGPRAMPLTATCRPHRAPPPMVTCRVRHVTPPTVRLRPPHVTPATAQDRRLRVTPATALARARRGMLGTGRLRVLCAMPGAGPHRIRGTPRRTGEYVRLAEIRGMARGANRTAVGSRLLRRASPGTGRGSTPRTGNSPAQPMGTRPRQHVDTCPNQPLCGLRPAPMVVTPMGAVQRRSTDHRRTAAR